MMECSISEAIRAFRLNARKLRNDNDACCNTLRNASAKRRESDKLPCPSLSNSSSDAGGMLHRSERDRALRIGAPAGTHRSRNSSL